MARRSLCFVVMPFGSGPRAPARKALLDDIYAHLISPAVQEAGLRPHRSDEEIGGGIFQKRIFEHLAVCEYAVADLSFANPNVFYELGIRHALRPWSTVLIYQDDVPLPLDVAPATALAYSADVLTDPPALERFRARLGERLRAARSRDVDSPVFQLVAGLPIPEIDHRRVDAMLDALDHDEHANRRISEAQQRGLDALRSLRAELDEDRLPAESLVALLLAFRAVQGWQEMVDLVADMPAEVADVWLVREQFALALGRLHHFDAAVEILSELLERRPSSESYGVLGGVYKRYWLHVVEQGGSTFRAAGLLDRASETYRRGFECDPRDPYPGVNAVVLGQLAGDQHAEHAREMLPAVRYAAGLRIRERRADYWDYASVVELAAVSGDWATVHRAARGMLARLTERFQAATTTANLKLIGDICRPRGDGPQLDALLEELNRHEEQG
ncbi:MAG TPA: TRAFs-binding domain-containing protein [Dermatophilaceae bacterium]|nr:TRAFs-binding domain-containing protein [Dermatophilaceae bacterium]